MECYSKFDAAATKCRKCPLKKYCREAGEIPLLPRARISELGASAPLEYEDTPEEQNSPRHTRAELMEVISFMAALDVNTLELVSAKLGNPDATCEELAQMRNLSRQAVHKAVKKWCASVPELEILLRNRQCRNRSHPQTTFMEEVCKIRQSLRKKKSGSPANGSSSCRSLISWKPSFSLSGMNILKGSAILRKD